MHVCVNYRVKKDKVKKKKKTAMGRDEEGNKVVLSTIDKASMNDVRIVQRNLVYIIGLAPHLAVEEVATHDRYIVYI